MKQTSSVPFKTKWIFACNYIRKNAKAKGFLYAVSGLLAISGMAFTFQNISDTAVGIVMLVTGTLLFLGTAYLSWTSGITRN